MSAANDLLVKARCEWELPEARVKALCEYGCESVDVNAGVPPIRYFRSGKEILRMADVYYKEKELENAFILYSKFITLFVEKLPKHPGYQTFQKAGSSEISSNKQKLMSEAFPKAEELKKKLKFIYTKQHEVWKAEEEQRMAQKKLKEEEEARRQEDEAKQREERQRFEEEGKWRMLQERARQDEGGVGIKPPTYEDVLIDHDRYITPPSALAEPAVPDRNTKPGGIAAGAVGAGGLSADYIPDRSLKPHFTSVLSSSTNRYGLRDLFIPGDLPIKFQNIALSNTNQNIETCAVLAGKLHKNSFIVTHFIIPKQDGTSDSCTTRKEEDIFTYQDSYDLITLGWVHTHPSQTAFLSSIDLHTHCSYQLMLPEAVAIVCAPKYDELGLFSLTPDGMNVVSTCTTTGFHKHASSNDLFENSDHVKVDSSISCKWVDFR